MNVDAVLIAGPTASGKSAAALELAERLSGAVINADSMQVYAELRALSARPTAEDEARVPHVLYGHVSVRERYSAGRYAEDVRRALGDARKRGLLPIFAGGTGLYFRVLTEGLSPIPVVPAEVRAQVRARFDAIGREAFFGELAARDPEIAARLAPSDTQRILRAADVMEATGLPLSHWQKEAGRAPLAGLRLAKFVLSPPRELLWDRIDRRFAQMMDAGGLEETRKLMGLDPTLPAARALGIPELLRHLRGETGLEEAIAASQLATRQYAKRQVTWFRKYMADWKWREGADVSNFITCVQQYVS